VLPSVLVDGQVAGVWRPVAGGIEVTAFTKLSRRTCADLAAEVVGAIEAHASMGAPPSTASLRALGFETRDALSSTLGTDRYLERCSIGASRPLTETVHRTRNALLARTLDG